MATPTYRDVVRPTLIDTAIPSNGRALAAQNLADKLKGWSRAGLEFSAELSAEAGRREGAEAGRTDDPRLRAGMSALTAYGRAYNDAATRAYAVRSEADADEQAIRLEAEAGNDPEKFRAAFGAARDTVLEDAPKETRALLAEVYDRRMASGVSNILRSQQAEVLKEARSAVVEGIERHTDRLAQLKSTNDPVLHAQAEEEQIKLNMLIDAAENDGTLSKTEAGALRLDTSRRSLMQTVTYRFRQELDSPYGDPVGFIEDLREINKSSNSLPPETEEKLIADLLGELQQRNSLAAADRARSNGAQQARWLEGEREVTDDLLNGRLSTSKLSRMLSEDALDPAIARTMYNELKAGGDRPDDARERFRVETTLLEQSEEDISQNSALSWQTRRELILKRREWVAGWRSSQEAREAADRIDRSLGIVPGISSKLLSEDELRKRDRALTAWYNAVDSLPPEQRNGKIIDLAESVSNQYIRDTAQKQAASLRKKILQLQEDAASGKLDDQEMKENQRSIEAAERRLRETEAKAK